MLLIYQARIAIAGDVAMGDLEGRLLACPEGFNSSADPTKVRASLGTLARILPTEGDILLAGHGSDVLLEAKASYKSGGRIKSEVRGARSPFFSPCFLQE